MQTNEKKEEKQQKTNTPLIGLSGIPNSAQSTFNNRAAKWAPAECPTTVILKKEF